MSKAIRASWWVIIAALLLTPMAFSQNPVYLTLNDGGNNGAVGGIYVGPYDATLSSGPNQSGTHTQIICDDFEHEVTTGQSWYANVTSFTSITNSTQGLVWSGATQSGVGLGGPIGNMVQGYTAMAYLASQLLGANSTQAGYLAYAIWSIFDASAVQSWLNTHGAGNMWAQVQSMAQGAMTAVLNNQVKQSDYAGWEILTPVNQGPGAPQEFFMFVPEGGTAVMYLLLAGFACFGTMFFKSRRRQASGAV